MAPCHRLDERFYRGGKKYLIVGTLADVPFGGNFEPEPVEPEVFDQVFGMRRR